MRPEERRRRRARVEHVILGLLVGIVLPLASSMEGTRLYAWTMFAGTEAYQLDIVAFDGRGGAQAINPTELAATAAPHLAVYLAGADHFRTGSALVAVLRAHVDDLAAHVCDTAVGARSVEVALRERPRGAPPRTTLARARCAP